MIYRNVAALTECFCGELISGFEVDKFWAGKSDR